MVRYDGQVFVGVKEGAYEPSSPLRHVTELNSALSELNILEGKPVLFLYCDGGPDHRLTYLSVKLSLICLFLKNDLDFSVHVELHRISHGEIQLRG